MLDDLTYLATALSVVKQGGTLVLTGPDPLSPKAAPQYGATLESSTGARSANGYGSTLEFALVAVMSDWEGRSSYGAGVQQEGCDTRRLSAEL